jgi:Family of unknown function (DUF6159)
MDTFSRSWDLLRQSFAILKSDKALMWLPIISAIFCLAATAIIFSSALLVLGSSSIIPHVIRHQKVLYQQVTPFVFLFYVVTYSIATFFNVALVGIASNRLAGGNGTLDYGLQVAWQRKWRILQWALLAATVGMLLRMLEGRANFVGRITTSITGFVWSLASFFVVPLLAAEDMGPVEALYRSAEIFRDTWGEEVVGGFSFAFIFLLLVLPGLLLPPLLVARLGRTGLLAGVAVGTIYCLLLCIVSSAVQGIFVAALYRYATTQEVTGGFDGEDLAGAWQSKE